MENIEDIIKQLKNEKERLNQEAAKYVEKGEDNFELLEKMSSIDIAINELEKWQLH